MFAHVASLVVFIVFVGGFLDVSQAIGFNRNGLGVGLLVLCVILAAFFAMVVSVPFVRDSQAVQRCGRRCCGSGAKTTETSNEKQKQKKRNNVKPSGDGAFAYDNPMGGGDYDDDVDRDRNKEYTVTMYL